MTSRIRSKTKVPRVEGQAEDEKLKSEDTISDDSDSDRDVRMSEAASSDIIDVNSCSNLST
jgi:hypothetical protein